MLHNPELNELFFRMKFDLNFCEIFINYLKQIIASNNEKEANGVKLLINLVQSRN